MNRLLPLSLLTITVGLAAQEPRERVWTPTYDVFDSTPRITSPGYTQWRDSTYGWRVSLERTFDIRGADSGSWNPKWRIHLLDDGRVLVGRPNPIGIELYDVEGRFVRAIGREGTGPEEYRSAMSFTAVGDTVVVHDGLAGRAVLYTLDGRFLRSFLTDIRSIGQRVAIDPRGYFRVEQNFSRPGDSVRTQWVHFNLRGERVDSINRPAQPAPHGWELNIGTRSNFFVVPYAPTPKAEFLPDGSLVFGTTDRWDFVRINPTDTALIFRRTNVQIDSLPVAHGDTVFASISRGDPALAQVASRSDLPSHFPAWNDLRSDRLGNLWVSSGYFFRRNHYWSIFGPDGRYLGAVKSWFEHFTPSSFGTDRIAYVGYVDGGRPVVRIYRVTR